MKYLKRFTEGSEVVSVDGIHKEYRLKNLPHAGDHLKKGGEISIFQQDWFEKLLPNKLHIHSKPNLKKLNFDQSLSDVDTSDIVYSLEKNDCTIDSDLVQFNYYHNTIKEPEDVIKDGEPDFLEFDIHFVRNTKGIKLLVNITYGDNMSYEFTIETPNKINVNHYTGVGSLYDSDTHFGFTEESIKDLVKFFNAFNHGIKLTEKDLSFLDQHEDSYKHDVHDPNHLYTDDSDLIEFENSIKESNDLDIYLVICNAKPPKYNYLPKVIKYLRYKNLPFKIAYTPDDVIRYNTQYNIIGAFSTGSDFSMKIPSNNNEFSTSETALDVLNCPILAMCYGFQSMAKFYGQEITGGELNCDQFLLTDFDESHFLFKGIDLTQQKLSFCFHDYPVNIPSGFENIAMLGDVISGISNSSIDRYGILFHPEELIETYIILDNFVNHCESKVVQKDTFKLQTFESFIKKTNK
jgi:GMP synthase-like glutamine amidotransferase